jgi:hypothetical protein
MPLLVILMLLPRYNLCALPVPVGSTPSVVLY